MTGVNAYDGPATLPWRANRCFAMACEVTAVVTETGSGWQVTLNPTGEDDTWAVRLFPKPWQLIFPDGSRFDVALTPSSGESFLAVEMTRGQTDRWREPAPRELTKRGNRGSCSGAKLGCWCVGGAAQ